MNSSCNDHDAIRITPLIDSTNDDHGCIMTLFENVLTQEEASQLLTHLHSELPWKLETDAFGKQGRATCYFADEDCVFSYVGLRLAPQPWHPLLDQLRQRVQSIIDASTTTKNEKSNNDDESNTTVSLTACLANLFVGTEDHIPFHYDEARAHGRSKTVATLSLGGPRPFCWRRQEAQLHNSAVSPHSSLDLPSGSILLMQGPTQEYYEHALPSPTPQNNTTSSSGDGDNRTMAPPMRISLTFRSIVPGYEDGRNIATDQCTVEPVTTEKAS